MEALGYNSPRPVSEILPLIDEQRNNWLAVLSMVSSDSVELPGVCGEWSVKDLVGHVAFWDRQVIDDIEGYVAERPSLGNPWQEWNDSEAANRARLPFDAVWTEMLDNHTRMLDRLRMVTEIDGEMVAIDTWEHYQEHAAEIEQWLANQDR